MSLYFYIFLSLTPCSLRIQIVIPRILGEETPKEKIDSALEDLNESLRVFEAKFLQDRPFIAGDHLSLADLVAIVEIMQVCRHNFSFTSFIQNYYKQAVEENPKKMSI